ncbi:hypothetical protein ScPMuIL_008944 [Solemya velum]
MDADESKLNGTGETTEIKKSKRRSKGFKLSLLKRFSRSASDASPAHDESVVIGALAAAGQNYSDDSHPNSPIRERLMSDPTPCRKHVNTDTNSESVDADLDFRHGHSASHRSCSRQKSSPFIPASIEDHVDVRNSKDFDSNVLAFPNGYDINDTYLHSFGNLDLHPSLYCHDMIQDGHRDHTGTTSKRSLPSREGDSSYYSDISLLSPSSVNSWGHFSKSTRNRYKYRRSDCSSDSEDDAAFLKTLTLSNKSKADSGMGSPKVHLPVLVKHSSNASKDVDKLDHYSHHDNTVDKVLPTKFRDRSAAMVEWFSEFNDEQKNIMLKEFLECCHLPQIHLLSVQMQSRLHRGCPPNCQDILTWLPSNISRKIMSYLDPVSLAQASQVCSLWHQIADEASFWRRFCCQQKWRLSKAAEHKQVISHMSEGSIQWKKVFAERYRLWHNWLMGRCTVRTFEGHNQGISCVQFDDTRIVSGSHDKTIKVWNIRTNAQWSVQTLVGHSGTVRCLHLEGNRLVSGSTDKSIKVWDLSTQESWSSIACKVTMLGHTDTVRCLQVDDEKVISGSYDLMLKIWDIRTGVCRRTLRGHQAPVLCVQFNDTKIVSGSCDKTIKVWNFEGSCILTLTGHQDAVTCLQFDATRIISGSIDCNLKFWDIHTGDCVNTIDWKAAEGHTRVVRCLQADSWRLVSAADDKTIKVWNVETGQRLVTLKNHTDGVTCLQFNDFIIVSGSYDKTVKLWDFSCC